jgi:hypothetical protein
MFNYFKKTMKKISAVIFVFICLLYNGCGDTEIDSVWRKQNITIDGNDNDWSNSLISLDKINASVGMTNDNEFLYLCLSTNDPELENKIISGGLTLWFQGNDDENNKFGVHYPLGMSDTAMPSFDENMKPGDRPGDPFKMQGSLLKNQTSLEIINTNNNKIRVPLKELKDIQIKATLNDGKLVYEMKIPLNQKNTTTYALNANAGSAIKIGIESGTNNSRNRAGSMPPDGGFDMPQGDDEGPGGGGPGGGPGGGGFPPGGMGREMSSSQSINFSIDVKLASDK